MPARPRAILFDLGGTVLEERGYDLAAGVRALLCDPGFRTRRRAGDLDAVLRELKTAIDRVQRTNAAEFSMRRWLEAELGPAPAATLAAAEALLWERSAELVPMPGAAEGLAALGAGGVAAAVVSNAVFASETLAAELARHDLPGGFAFVLSSADLGIRKPDPAIFREALARLGAEPETTWFVGDSFANDVAGAHAAGLTPVWLSRAGGPDAAIPHERVADWNALLRLYRASLAGPRAR